MKHEAWIFGLSTIFFVIVSPAYWLITGDWTGTSALVMTTLLVAMITLYLGFHAARMDPRPEDRKNAEIADGAGELGFFPPYSWWPLWCGCHARRDRLRHRARCLVAGRHRHGPRRPGAEWPRLRVLQGRTRALARPVPQKVRRARPVLDLVVRSGAVPRAGSAGCAPATSLRQSKTRRARRTACEPCHATVAANRFVADAGLRWDGNLYLVRGVSSACLSVVLACSPPPSRAAS